MKVITLTPQLFDDACSSLSKLMLERIAPAAIIGIRTGGAEVGKRVVSCFDQAGLSVSYLEVLARRSSTQTKEKAGLRTWLRYMPWFMLDWLRILEHWLSRWRSRTESSRVVEFNDDFEEQIRQLGKATVYIVDDAVDSGATIHRVADAVAKLNSSLDIRVAVLVVTQARSGELPILSLYQDVLIRFPWSMDYRDEEQ